MRVACAAPRLRKRTRLQDKKHGTFIPFLYSDLTLDNVNESSFFTGAHSQREARVIDVFREGRGLYKLVGLQRYNWIQRLNFYYIFLLV